MKRALFILLALTLLLSVTPASAIQTQALSLTEQQALMGRLEHLDGREVLAVSFQRLPSTGQPCAFVVTTEDSQNPELASHFAHWYLTNDREPQLVMDGQHLSEDYDPMMAGSFGATELLQGFVQGEELYFVVTLLADGQLGEMSILYHAGRDGLKEVPGFHYGVWHPKAGLLELCLEYPTSEYDEDETVLVPMFYVPTPDQAQPLGALMIEETDLQRLVNWEEIDKQLSALSNEDKIFYYMANNIIIYLYEETIGETRYNYFGFIGIEDDLGFYIRPMATSARDIQYLAQLDQPFWQHVDNIDQATMPGNYPFYQFDLFHPDAFMEENEKAAPLFHLEW